MEQNEQDYEFMLKVKEVYEQSKGREENSIRAVATKLGLSRTKVRKILVTLGVIQSPITETAKKLKEQGMSLIDIADKLGVSIATVSTYLPYDTVIYNGEAKSPNAVRIDRYRERLKNVADTQVHHTERKNIEGDTDMDIKEQKFKVYKLHLELDTEGADFEALKKYGKVKNGITRDVLVPADMTLHALHYVIQRLFGWQNSHLHHFELTENVFLKFTDNSFMKWSDYCGIYFRFPSDDMDDIYWDDDYNGDVSVKTWFRRKYSAIYQYHGISEHFMEARYELNEFISENKTIRVAPPFDEWMNMSEKEKKTVRIKNIEDVTCEEIDFSFENGDTAELLERLSISELLTEKSIETAPDVTEAFERYQVSLSKFKKLHNQMINGNDIDYWKTMTKLDGKALPITNELLYQYDYGDGWEVKITLTDEYYSDDTWEHMHNGLTVVPITDEDSYDDQTPFYRNGEPVEGELHDQICTVVAYRKPLCIAADGLPVLDDVGGIGGFCGMLLGLHSKPCGGYPYENAEETKVWAAGMGWTGRMNKPEKIL